MRVGLLCMCVGEWVTVRWVFLWTKHWSLSFRQKRQSNDRATGLTHLPPNRRLTRKHSRTHSGASIHAAQDRLHPQHHHRHQHHHHHRPESIHLECEVALPWLINRQMGQSMDVFHWITIWLCVCARVCVWEWGYCARDILIKIWQHFLQSKTYVVFLSGLS